MILTMHTIVSLVSPIITHTNYVVQPQKLNADGFIIGHQHIVVQRMPQGLRPPDPRQFEVFKGLDQPPDANGELTDVIPGLTPGRYRMCTIAGAGAHQPVIMPVAQRGSQNDCIRFTVVPQNQGLQQPIALRRRGFDRGWMRNIGRRGVLS
jgi:hypothetical protein